MSSMSTTTLRHVTGVTRGAAVLIVCAAVLLPVYWMIATAIQRPATTLLYPPPLLPIEFVPDGFINIFRDLPLLSWLRNSAVLAGIATVITTVLSVFGAYTLSALDWPGKALFGALLLLTQMMPEAIIVVPAFQLYNDLGLLQSLAALSLLHAAFVLPIGIWILRSAFDAVPREVADAARIDGCGHLGVLARVILPLAAPAIAAVAIVAFFASWGEYLFATTMISQTEKYPASVGLATLISQLDTPVSELLAGGLVYALPPVVLYMIIQRFMIAGLTAGAVKG